MDRPITRRDFLNGVGVAVGGALLSSSLARAMGLGVPESALYPPGHALRDGESWAESAEEVELTYVRGGRAERVRAGHVVMGCWHAVIPYLCPELAERQQEALLYGPYTNAAIDQAYRAVREISESGG